jgi:hypothetical protein
MCEMEKKVQSLRIQRRNQRCSERKRIYRNNILSTRTADPLCLHDTMVSRIMRGLSGILKLYEQYGAIRLLALLPKTRR